jgi:hypothetical protein
MPTEVGIHVLTRRAETDVDGSPSRAMTNGNWARPPFNLKRSLYVFLAFQNSAYPLNTSVTFF